MVRGLVADSYRERAAIKLNAATTMMTTTTLTRCANENELHKMKHICFKYKYVWIVFVCNWWRWRTADGGGSGRLNIWTLLTSIFNFIFVLFMCYFTSPTNEKLKNWPLYVDLLFRVCINAMRQSFRAYFLYSFQIDKICDGSTAKVRIILSRMACYWSARKKNMISNCPCMHRHTARCTVHSAHTYTIWLMH